MERGDHITQLLRSWSQGDQAAMEELMPLVFDELHRVARRYMSGERPGHTLQTTALVNETYLRLVNSDGPNWEGRTHFFGVCAQMILRLEILVDWTRSRQALKRGGACPHAGSGQRSTGRREPAGNESGGAGRRPQRAFHYRCAQGPSGGAAVFRRIERQGNRGNPGHFGGDGAAGLENGEELAAPRTQPEEAPAWNLTAGEEIERIYHQALEQDPGRRAAFVHHASHGDRSLEQEVASLLEQTDEKSSFLEERAIEVAARDLATAPSHPSSIGRYRILRLLGEGGMGAVYEAEQEEPRRVVALKVIRLGLATPERLRRFRHESQALGRLQHPGIAQIHESGTADTGFGPQPYFAMELIRGLPLHKYGEAHLLDARQKLAMIAKICDAVEHSTNGD